MVVESGKFAGGIVVHVAKGDPLEFGRPKLETRKKAEIRTRPEKALVRFSDFDIRISF